MVKGRKRSKFRKLSEIYAQLDAEATRNQNQQENQNQAPELQEENQIGYRNFKKIRMCNQNFEKLDIFWILILLIQTLFSYHGMYFGPIKVVFFFFVVLDKVDFDFALDFTNFQELQQGCRPIHEKRDLSRCQYSSFTKIMIIGSYYFMKDPKSKAMLSSSESVTVFHVPSSPTPPFSLINSDLHWHFICILTFCCRL